MKFILFNVEDINKTVINKIDIGENHYIDEIVLCKDKLNFLNENPKSFWEKIKYNFYNKNVEKAILKSLNGYDKKWGYILSKNIKFNNKYLLNKTQQMLGYKFTNTNELDNNIFKYIAEYVRHNNNIKSHEIKVLLVASSNKNLNIGLLENLIKQYKSVDVYLNDTPCENILKRIRKINQNEGTTIEILRKERKNFAEYNVVYFVDDTKENYPRFRFNKAALVLDIETANTDKYNSNLAYLQKYLTKNETLQEKIGELKQNYNYLELAGVVKKITNVLDKS